MEFPYALKVKILHKFCKLFKKETGYSIIEFKINCQLEEACNLLKITNMQISDIAMEAGFNNVSYFSKIFKKKYQLTPKIYRELYKRTTNEHA